MPQNRTWTRAASWISSASLVASVTAFALLVPGEYYMILPDTLIAPALVTLFAAAVCGALGFVAGMLALPGGGGRRAVLAMALGAGAAVPAILFVMVGIAAIASM